VDGGGLVMAAGDGNGQCLWFIACIFLDGSHVTLFFIDANQLFANHTLLLIQAIN